MEKEKLTGRDLTDNLMQHLAYAGMNLSSFGCCGCPGLYAGMKLKTLRLSHSSTIT